MTQTSSASFRSRLRAVQRALPDHTAVLISDHFHLLYLTGFVTLTPYEREAFLLVTQNSATLYLSSFSDAQEVPGLTVTSFSSRTPLSGAVETICKNEKLQQLFYDPRTLSVNEWQPLSRVLPAKLFTPQTEDLVTQLRQVKDHREQSSLRQANHLTHQALNTTLQQLHAGMTEQEVRDFFEAQLREKHVTGFAFPTIVAFGDHTALPHHQPTTRRLTTNQPVLIDCGAKWDHYCADVTRTIWFGEQPSAQFLNVEKVVTEAYHAAFQLCESKAEQSKLLTAAQIDHAARKVIEAAGLGAHFIHTTGHGVGLYIHESPSLNSSNPTPLQPGTVITIEPGIYLDGEFGYRFENSVLLTEHGAQEIGVS